jgi:hypothetical protein
VLIEHPGSDHKRRSGIQPDWRAPDLAGAVDRILGE